MNQANEPDPRLSMLEAMMTIRAYEHKLVAINAQTGAAGTCTAVGQEAAAVGVVRALAPHFLGQRLADRIVCRDL